MTDKELEEIHRFSSNNAESLKDSRLCGCFFCERIFTVEEGAWQMHNLNYATVDGGKTLMCPYCDCDSLILDASGVKITKKLLAQMNKRYFH